MKMNKLFFGLLLQAAFYSGSLYAQADLRTDAYSICLLYTSDAADEL